METEIESLKYSLNDLDSKYNELKQKEQTLKDKKEEINNKLTQNQIAVLEITNNIKIQKKQNKRKQRDLLKAKQNLQKMEKDHEQQIQCIDQEIMGLDGENQKLAADIQNFKEREKDQIETLQRLNREIAEYETKINNFDPQRMNMTETTSTDNQISTDNQFDREPLIIDDDSEKTESEDDGDDDIRYPQNRNIRNMNRNRVSINDFNDNHNRNNNNNNNHHSDNNGVEIDTNNILHTFNTNNINDKGISFEDYVNPPTDVTNDGITDDEILKQTMSMESRVPSLEPQSQELPATQHSSTDTQISERNQENMPLKKLSLHRRSRATTTQ